jgi:streptogramin lyase
MQSTLSIKNLMAILFAVALSSAAYAQDTLYVGDYQAQQILRYDQNGNIINPDPWLGAAGLNGVATKGEGIAVGVGYPTTGSFAFGNIADPIFIANAAPANGSQTIEVVNPNATAGTNPVVNANFITGLQGVANIALSPNGQDLYVAQQLGGTSGTGSISEYNALTGALITSVDVVAAHDVVVSANGTVYVTAYAAGSAQSVGVIDFSANLTNQQTFLAPGAYAGSGNTGLSHVTGMVFDSGGNLWVANVYTVSNSVRGTGPSAQNFVAEYSPSGALLATYESSGNHLFTVFGLDLGPDGNIYAASFNGGEITEINTTTGVLSTFIAMPNGDTPKYATWSTESVTYVPEPQTYASISISLGGLLFLLIIRRLRRTWRARVPDTLDTSASSVSG